MDMNRKIQNIEMGNRFIRDLSNDIRTNTDSGNGMIVYTLPINYGLAHFITAIIMWAILEVEYKYNLTLLIARCVIIILCFSCFLLFVNTKLNIENSFVALIVSSIIILILLPLFAYGIGIDIRLYLNKIRQRL